MPYTNLQKIRFDDVDGAGIVYYPQFFHLCHKAFEDFFDTVAGIPYPKMIAEMRRGFPTVTIDSVFVKPLRYGDTAVVTLGVTRIGRSSVVFRYSIDKQGGDLCFWTETTCVLIDLDSLGAVPIGADLRAPLERLGPNPVQKPERS